MANILKRTSFLSLSQDHKANVDKNQVQSLLVLELMTLQLFYGLQGQSHLIGSEETAHARLTVMPSGSRDVLIQSMEGLLEVISCAVNLKIYPAILYRSTSFCAVILLFNDLEFSKNCTIFQVL